MDLSEFFQEHPSVAVAFSGGTDSAYLLYEAKRCAESVKAYYAKSAFQPQFELEDALRLVDELDVPLTVIDVDVLSDEDIIANTQRRCYHCKRRIFSMIRERALGEGFNVLLDGTNASDDVSDRPGMAALQELSVLSPLRLCGLTKADVRRLSREAGLFTWDKPAYACLATRIFPGQRIDGRLLARTEAAEGFLASLGFRDFRVRTVGEIARIQVVPSQLSLLMLHRTEILDRLGKEYSGVCLDLETRDGQ
ncbi:MAG: ATP-dependent sacrificial sulfur transferase LarE [Victivallales bacterium]|nr:ATP-dependent sacrificial sulfur transferase LarE [Victivallales bacterium]